VPTRISFTDPDALTGRSDLTPARLTADEPGWEDGAIVPTDLWQPMSRADATSLQANGHTPSSTLVEIVRVPIDVTTTHTMVAESPDRIEPFGAPRPVEFVGSAHPRDNAVVRNPNQCAHREHWQDLLSWSTPCRVTIGPKTLGTRGAGGWRASCAPTARR
jgi:hypothetical protein